MIAFQLRADRFAQTGAFGVSAFGGARYGGEDWPPYVVPDPGAGSDDLTRELVQRVAEIVLTRNGRPVSVRPVDSWPQWRVRWPALTAEQVAALWVFCQARVFDLLPTGQPGVSVPVYWSDADFAPEPVGPNLYALTATLSKAVV